MAILATPATRVSFLLKYVGHGHLGLIKYVGRSLQITTSDSHRKRIAQLRTYSPGGGATAVAPHHDYSKQMLKSNLIHAITTLLFES